MFNWLNRMRAAKAVAADPPPPSPPIGFKAANMKELLQDRLELAEWVETYIIRSRPWEENYEFTPDEEAQRSLEITFEQKMRLAKEFHILRIAGVLIFMRQLYEDGAYEALLHDLAKRLAGAVDLDTETVGQALSEYVRFSLDGDEGKVETLYMTRMYDDNPNYLRMRMSGIGSIAVSHIGSSFDVFRDAVNGLVKG